MESTVAGVAVLPLAWYAFVMGITPGPNNLMLAASGMNFGLRRTLPHIAGVFVGFSALIVFAGAGIGTLYAQLPLAQDVLRVLGAGFLAWLAWQIARAEGGDGAAEDARPLRFVEAAAFQFMNPKGWTFALTASAGFLREPGLAAVSVLTLTGMATTLLSTTTWTLFGAGLARWIGDATVRRRLNWFFAAALLATIPLLLFD